MPNTPFPQSGKIKVTPEQSVIVQNRLTQLGFKHRSSAGFRANNSKVCIYWRSNLFDIRGDGYIGQFAGDSRTKYTMTLFESEGEVKICQNCKRYWVAPFPEKCICNSTSLAPTHPSNKDLAENFKESEGEEDVWEEYDRLYDEKYFNDPFATIEHFKELRKSTFNISRK